MNRKLKNTLVASVFAAGALLGLTGCASYVEGEVVEVEDGMGPNGPMLELEVSSGNYRGLGEVPTYEAHVPTDSGCEVGDIYNPRTETCD